MNKLKELILKMILKDMERNKQGKPSMISYLALVIALISLGLRIISK